MTLRRSTASTAAAQTAPVGPTCFAIVFAAAPWHPAVAESVPAVTGPGWGSVLQLFAGLAVVLAAIGVAAWAARRWTPVGRPGGLLRVVGGVMVGPRERVVVVEMQDTWLVLGVTAQQVNTLHTLARPAGAPGALPVQPADRNFSRWLQKAIKGEGA
jgi:flagellar protein FliO/FliZ